MGKSGVAYSTEKGSTLTLVNKCCDIAWPYNALAFTVNNGDKSTQWICILTDIAAALNIRKNTFNCQGDRRLRTFCWSFRGPFGQSHHSRL